MANPKTEIIISAKDETIAAFNTIKGSLTSLQGLALGLSTGALASSVKSAADFADQMGKAAQKVGVTTESLSKLKYAADLSDVGFESLQTGLKKLSINMVNAAAGGKEAKEAFSRVGVAIKDSAGNMRGAESVIGDIATKFASMPDGVTKTALAVQLFGKSGAELIPLLNGGAAGLKEMGDEAERFGVVIGSDMARQSEIFNDNLTRMGKLFEGFKISIGNSVLPALEQITQKMVAAAKEGGILYGVLKAIGEAEGIALFGTDKQQRGNRIKNIDREMIDVASALRSETFRDGANGVVAMTDDQRTKLKMQLRALALEKNQLMGQVEREAAAGVSGQSDKNTPGISDNSGDSSGKAAAAKALAASQDYMRGVASLQVDVEKLNEKDKTQIELLQEKLDAMVRLNPVMREYLQSQLDIASAAAESIRAEDVLRSFYEAQAQGDQNAAEIADAEQKAIDYREQQYADMATALKVENENLNVDLLTSDKARARAQIDLEHNRALERISNLTLESDQAQELIEQETANYELRIKQIDNTKAMTKELGMTFTSAFEDAITGGKKFSDVLQSLALDIEKLLIRRTVTEPLMNMVDGALSGSGGGGGFFDWLGGIFGGGKATGGPVSYGTTYLVGERGPELFTPGASGAITPNNMLGGGGGGVVVNLIESPGSGGQVSQSRGDDGVLTVDIMVEQIETKLKRNISRGSGIAPTLESVYGLNRAVGAVR